MLQEQQIRQTISDYFKLEQRAEHLAKITGLEERYFSCYIDRIEFSEDVINYRFVYCKYGIDYVYDCLPLRYLWMNDDDVIAEVKEAHLRKLVELLGKQAAWERLMKEAMEHAERF